MNKLDLYIDFDGVILDTIPAIDEELDKAEIPLEDRFTDDVKLNQTLVKFYSKDFLDSCEIIDNAIENIEILMTLGIFDIHILTHVNSVNEAYLKMDYLQERIPSLDVICVDRLVRKHTVVNPNGAILIDDRFQNTEQFTLAGGIGLQFDPTGESKYTSIRNLLDVLAIGEKLLKDKRMLKYENKNQI